MTECRFEDRLSGKALVMHDPCACITASAPGELDAAFARIQAAQARGKWLALLLDYALGAWLDPALAQDDYPWTSPRLTAWVFARVEHTQPWPIPALNSKLHLESTPGTDYATYCHTVQTLRAAMAQGDFYQVNYTFPIQLTAHGDLSHLYRVIANAHPSAHAVWFRDARRTILSFSPELFVARQGAQMTVRPMKGTAARHTDPVQDHRNAQTLQHSQKDRAENLMIVDLLRNDLGRIATPGSVRVPALFSLEKYPSVWTLTSTVTAHAPACSLRDILTALFPCGSVTGAPKIAAMRTLRRMESQARGIYCGSLGWLAPNGDLSLNVAIRTMEFPQAAAQRDRMVHTGVFGVGGGIVYDSQPAQEWQECLWKARLLNGSDTLCTSPPPPRTPSI